LGLQGLVASTEAPGWHPPMAPGFAPPGVPDSSVLSGGGQASRPILPDPSPAILAIWVEGAGAGEPAGHQSVAVGNPNGYYEQYSFAWQPLTDWWCGFDGIIYEDTSGPGAITDRFMWVTEQAAIDFKLFMRTQVDRGFIYSPFTTCRWYSQMIYDEQASLASDRGQVVQGPFPMPREGGDDSGFGVSSTRVSSSTTSSTAATTLAPEVGGAAAVSRGVSTTAGVFGPTTSKEVSN